MGSYITESERGKHGEKKTILLTVIIGFIISGCQGTQLQGKAVKPLQIGNNHEQKQEKADIAKRLLFSMDEVLEVKGVSVDESIYLAPRVKQLSRFRLEEIRRQAHKRIKERYPKASIHVSTDKKNLYRAGKARGKAAGTIN